MAREAQWLSSLFLKVLTDGAVTTSSGREFHSLMILMMKERILSDELTRGFSSRLECHLLDTRQFIIIIIIIIIIPI